ncbi:hypothetical protein Hanom_Chr09g00794811 [Helianthus anomalus]
MYGKRVFTPNPRWSQITYNNQIQTVLSAKSNYVALSTHLLANGSVKILF